MSYHGRPSEKTSRGEVLNLFEKKFQLKKFNSIQNDKQCIVRDLIPSKKKVLTWAGIEPGSPRLPVGSADHSAIRP